MALLTGPKLRNCTKCGKVFTSLRGEKLCRECTDEAKEFEQKVVEYIRDNPGTSMKEVMEATGATDKMLKRMMQEGIFSNTGGGEDFMYPCVGCGRPIRTGTYCTDCLGRLRNQTKKAAESMQIRIKEDRKMSTIERLDALAEREFEKENRSANIRRNFAQSLLKNRNNS